MSEAPNLVTAEQAAGIAEEYQFRSDGDAKDVCNLARSVIALTTQLAEANARADAAKTLALERAADALLECSIWCDSQERTDDGWRNGVFDARKHGMAAIRALSPMTPLQAAMQVPEVRALVEAARPFSLPDESEHPEDGGYVADLRAAIRALTAAQDTTPVVDGNGAEAEHKNDNTTR
jgi:hypothetical protein